MFVKCHHLCRLRENWSFEDCPTDWFPHKTDSDELGFFFRIIDRSMQSAPKPLSVGINFYEAYHAIHLTAFLSKSNLLESPEVVLQRELVALVLKEVALWCTPFRKFQDFFLFWHHHLVSHAPFTVYCVSWLSTQQNPNKTSMIPKCFSADPVKPHLRSRRTAKIYRELYGERWIKKKKNCSLFDHYWKNCPNVSHDVFLVTAACPSHSGMSLYPDRV